LYSSNNLLEKCYKYLSKTVRIRFTKLNGKGPKIRGHAAAVSSHLNVVDAKGLEKRGVHWQTLRTTTSERGANEPTRTILPEYGLSCKRTNWKREH
jgi:hypothetical protein